MKYSVLVSVCLKNALEPKFILKSRVIPVFLYGMYLYIMLSNWTIIILLLQKTAESNI